MSRGITVMSEKKRQRDATESGLTLEEYLEQSGVK